MSGGNKVTKFIRNNMMLTILVVICIVIAFTAPGFFTVPNILGIFRNNAFKGVIAFGMTMVIICGEIDLSIGSTVAGFEDFYYNLAAEKEMIHYWAGALTDAYCVMLDRILDRIGKYIDIALFGGDDLGTQQSTQLSVDMYREMIKPYHKKIYQFVHKKNPSVKVGLHCCGAIRTLMPELIDAGVQVLNPIQISAKNMNPRELKEEFGKDLVFWGGGADMQGFVNATSDPKAIYNHVRELIDIFAPGGNFIFAPVHNILDNVAPEKVLAIFQAALDYREEQRKAGR